MEGSAWRGLHVEGSAWRGRPPSPAEIQSIGGQYSFDWNEYLSYVFLDFNSITDARYLTIYKTLVTTMILCDIQVFGFRK